MRRLLLLGALLSAVGCDDAKGTGACVFEYENETEFYVLPNLPEAKELAEAFDARQRGTINLLLAKYSSKNVARGTSCKVLEKSGRFVKVQASELTGWVQAKKVGQATD